MRCREGPAILPSFGWVLVLVRAVACFFAEGVGDVTWVYYFRLFDVFDTGLA